MSGARLSAPVLPRIVLRQRLLDRLVEARNGAQSTWLFGPPGAGKTTLAACYVEYCGVPSLWYQLDPTDSDPATFFEYLSRAADVVAPGSRSALPRLTPEYQQGLPRFAREYGERLFARLPADCVLVLDNYQELAADSPLHSLLPQLIADRANGQLFVFASRERPPKAFARLQANQLLDVLDWRDLRFDPDECRDVLALHGELSTEEIDRHTRASGGWAAGLVLMSKGAATPAGNAAETTDRRVIFDYFAAEALRAVPERALSMLRCAALLPEFSAGMAAELSGRSEAQASKLLADLHRRRFFIQRHESLRPVYLLHPLFRGYLLDECNKRTGAQALRALKRRAAAVARDNAMTEAAFELMTDAEDWDALAAYIGSCAEGLLHAGRHRELLRWLDRLPERYFHEQPWLVLWRGSAQLPFAPQAAAESFEQAYLGLKAAGDVVGRYLAWAGGAETMSYLWDSFEAAPFWLAELEELVSQSTYPSVEIECRVLCALLPMMIWSEGSAARFPSLVERCATLVHGVDDATTVATLAGGLLYFQHAVSCDSKAAEHLIDTLHERIVHGDAMPSAKLYWYSQVVHGCVMSGRYEFGAQVMKEAARLIAEHGLEVLQITFTSCLARMYLVRLDTRNADLALGRLKSQITPGRRIEKLLYLFILGLRRLQGDDPHATLVALEDGLRLARETCAVYPEGLFLALSIYNLSQLGDSRRARECLDMLRATVDKCGSTSLRFHMLLGESELARQACDEVDLIASLTRAMRFGKEQRIVNPMDLSQPAIVLYELALEHGIETHYVREVVRVLQLKPNDPGKASPSWPWRVRLSTLGQWAVETNGVNRPLSARQRRVTALLTLLIAQHGKSLGKARIKDLLWPESEPDKAEQNLKSTIVRLRKLIGADVIEWRETSVRLDPRQVWVDCWEVEKLLASTQPSDSRRQLDPFRTIHKLYAGRVLETDDSPWVLAYRDRLHRKTCQAFVARARRFLQADEYAAVVELCRLGRDIDDTLEPLYRVQMEAHIGRNEPVEARRVYRACVDVLTKRLRTLPSSTTTVLAQKLQ